MCNYEFHWQDGTVTRVTAMTPTEAGQLARLTELTLPRLQAMFEIQLDRNSLNGT